MNKIKNIIDEIYYERKRIIIYIIVGLLLISCFIFYNHKEYEEEEEIVPSLKTIDKEEEKIEEPKKIYVDIKGEVKNPGCYEVQDGLRVKDVIDLAGGVLDSASTDNINLSTKVYDEMVLVISKKEEVTTIQNKDAIIVQDKKEYVNSNTIQSANGKVSINNAGVEELCTLNGIKEARAKKIIEYRNANGPFKSIDEIKNVSGIGESIFEKIKINITL